MSKVKEVFEHEKYDSLSRTWKVAGFVLCSAPTVTAPGSFVFSFLFFFFSFFTLPFSLFPREDIFDPAIQAAIPDSNWNIDYSLSGIDAEGWTYAYDYNTLNRTGAGSPTADWNTYVRRRKWRYVEKRQGGSAAVNEVRERNQARLNAQKPTGSTQAEKIGYVPRAQQAQMKATGLASAGMMRGQKKAPDQELDEESASGLARVSANNAEIDASVDEIGSALDRIAGIANNMKEEVSVPL